MSYFNRTMPHRLEFFACARVFALICAVVGVVLAVNGIVLQFFGGPLWLHGRCLVVAYDFQPAASVQRFDQRAEQWRAFTTFQLRWTVNYTSVEQRPLQGQFAIADDSQPTFSTFDGNASRAVPVPADGLLPGTKHDCAVRIPDDSKKAVWSAPASEASDVRWHYDSLTLFDHIYVSVTFVVATFTLLGCGVFLFLLSKCCDSDGFARAQLRSKHFNRGADTVEPAVTPGGLAADDLASVTMSAYDNKSSGCSRGRSRRRRRRTLM